MSAELDDNPVEVGCVSCNATWYKRLADICDESCCPICCDVIECRVYVCDNCYPTKEFVYKVPPGVCEFCGEPVTIHGEDTL